MGRQLNVQQQNAIVEDGIRRTASYWRLNGIPEALKIAGLERGVNWSKSIVVDLDIDFPGMPSLFGLLLTQDEKFIDFAVNTDESHERLKSVECWDDVSEKQNTNFHNRGIGVGRGALALKALRELNACGTVACEMCWYLYGISFKPPLCGVCAWSR
ncbi:MAG: hypothetical protein LBU11_05235 [Zoogloeaceae bacterium]|jgi:hypothetical protein|nr:hypothetical protein [Zoogloeaceae bacterium]